MLSLMQTKMVFHRLVEVINPMWCHCSQGQVVAMQVCILFCSFAFHYFSFNFLNSFFQIMLTCCILLWLLLIFPARAKD